jgi:hypothetical protein
MSDGRMYKLGEKLKMISCLFLESEFSELIKFTEFRKY